jgi:hypothetical protein
MRDFDPATCHIAEVTRPVAAAPCASSACAPSVQSQCRLPRVCDCAASVDQQPVPGAPLPHPLASRR